MRPAMMPYRFPRARLPGGGGVDKDYSSGFNGMPPSSPARPHRMPFEPVRTCVAAAVLLAVATGPACAGEAGVHTLGSVVRAVIERHPDLRVSAVEADIARAGLEEVEAGLDTGISLRAGVSDDRTPVIIGFQPAETQDATLSGSVTRPLASGGTLQFNADYSRTRQRFDSPLADQLALVNPAYRGGIGINYRHPLFRGEGRPDFREGIARAEAGIAAAESGRRVAAYGLALEAVGAYFRVLSDEVAIDIARNGVERARALLEYQRLREEFGLIESTDRAQAEALLAARQLELERASAQAALDRTALNRLMLRPGDAPLELVPPPVVAEVPALAEGLRDAEALRPELDLLRAQLAAAEAGVRIAREGDRPQLDLIAEAGVFALDSDAPGAFGFEPRDRFLGLSIELTDVLGRRAARAGLLGAEHERRRVLAERERVVERIRDELLAAHTSLATGREVLRLARRHAEAERRKFEAELARYRDGRSDTATLIQFEGELRAAELDAGMQRLALALAARQFAWARGTLLEELGIGLPAGATDP